VQSFVNFFVDFHLFPFLELRRKKNEGIKKLQQFFLFLVWFNARCIIIYKKTFPLALSTDSNLIHVRANRKELCESVKFKLCNHLFQLTHQFSEGEREKRTRSVPARKKVFRLSFVFNPSRNAITNGVFVTAGTSCFSDILQFPINHTLKLLFFPPLPPQ
jgi:hypothetical protein